jgi:hypothetical protein
MVKTMEKPDPKDYAEEAIPFDDVMRKLLKAKPKHRKAAPKPKEAKAKK